MFIFNFKIKSNQLFKKILIISLLIAISLFLLAGYNIVKQFFGEKISNEFNIPTPNVAEIQPKNYTNILKEVHENIDTYIGQKITFSGYVYRLADLKDSEFILARDMLIENTNQTVVVGFLCQYSNAKELTDNSWIKITGEIKKGYYYGDIPILEIMEIEKIDEPENAIVPSPKESYVPTAIIY